MNKEQRTEEVEKRILEKTERNMIKELVTHSDIRTEIMNRGLKEIQQGKIKLDGKTVLSAAKDQMNYEMKTQSNQLKMMEMMWHFASGESNQSEKYDRAIIEGETATDFDPAQKPPAHN